MKGISNTTMRPLWLALSAVSALALGGCSSTPPKTHSPSVQNEVQALAPDWLNHTKPGYVVARAPIVADDQAAATEAAMHQARGLFSERVRDSLAQYRQQQWRDAQIQPGSLEAQLRQRVRDALAGEDWLEVKLEARYVDTTANEVAVLVSANSDTQRAALQARLAQLDAQLADYKHASYRGSELNQLWALIPALPTLEERALVQAALAQMFGEVPSLANERMAYLMDRQISALFDSFVIGVDALTAEAERFEADLVRALKAAGLTISARRPSLILKYFIEQEREGQALTLIGDVELINRDSSRFATLSDEVTVSDDDPQRAQHAALAQLAQAVSALMLQQAMTHIEQHNDVKFSR